MKLGLWMMVCAVSVTVLSSKVWALPEKDISSERDAPKVLTYDEGRKKGYQDGVEGVPRKFATRGNKNALKHYNNGYKTGYRVGKEVAKQQKEEETKSHLVDHPLQPKPGDVPLSAENLAPPLSSSSIHARGRMSDTMHGHYTDAEQKLARIGKGLEVFVNKGKKEEESAKKNNAALTQLLDRAEEKVKAKEKEIDQLHKEAAAAERNHQQALARKDEAHARASEAKEDKIKAREREIERQEQVNTQLKERVRELLAEADQRERRFAEEKRKGENVHKDALARKQEVIREQSENIKELAGEIEQIHKAVVSLRADHESWRAGGISAARR